MGRKCGREEKRASGREVGGCVGRDLGREGGIELWREGGKGVSCSFGSFFHFPWKLQSGRFYRGVQVKTSPSQNAP